MKILIVVLKNSTRGGAWSVVGHLAKHLNGRGRDVFFFHGERSAIFIFEGKTKLGFPFAGRHPLLSALKDFAPLVRSETVFGQSLLCS